MKKLTAAVILLSLMGCRDASGPSGGESPGGEAVVWFNGLSATADVWYPEADSMIHGAWSTGSAPNHIASLGNRRFALLSSLEAELFTASVDEPGEFLLSVPLPVGSNPYSFAVDGDSAWVSLLLADSLMELDLSDGVASGGFSTRSNPCGTAAAAGLVFVGYSNWPDVSSEGGVSVFDPGTGEELAWLNTGVNTHWLTMQPTGLLHCYSTTYQDDGRITVIDPLDSCSIVTVIECGGAPGEGVYREGSFISPDGWGSGGLVVYDESGSWQRTSLGFAPSGLALGGDCLYATCFGGNTVYVLDPETFAVTDSIQSSGEGPQGIIAVDQGT